MLFLNLTIKSMVFAVAHLFLRFPSSCPQKPCNHFLSPLGEIGSVFILATLFRFSPSQTSSPPNRYLW
jgi:hypothetical protein